MISRLLELFRQQPKPAKPTPTIKPVKEEVKTVEPPTDFSGMTLGQKQRVFTRMIGLLIEYAYQSGYELTFGDAYRDPRAFGPTGTRKLYSSANSNHKRRLAVDFNLFKDGQFLTASEDHAPLGQFWESMGGAWGGRFNDGNHYSLEHEGFK